MIRNNQKGGATLYLIGILNLFLVCLFAFQFSAFLNTSFKIQTCHRLIKKISAKNEKRILNLVSKNRVRKVEALARRLEFEEAEDVEYINTSNREVAAKTK